MQGFVDGFDAEGRTIFGWALDPAGGSATVFAEQAGVRLAQAAACEPREDLSDCGFALVLPDAIPADALLDGSVIVRAADGTELPLYEGFAEALRAGAAAPALFDEPVPMPMPVPEPRLELHLELPPEISVERDARQIEGFVDGFDRDSRTIFGWARDLDTDAPVTVRIERQGRLLAQGRADDSRADMPACGFAVPLAEVVDEEDLLDGTVAVIAGGERLPLFQSFTEDLERTVKEAQALRLAMPRLGVSLALDRSSRFDITLERLTYACEFQPRFGSRRLVVMLPNYVNRETSTPPVFLRWPDLSDLGHVLQISDPTLLLSNELQLGSFLGREHDDPISGVTAIATDVAERLGVAEEHILFFGLSGGGMAAVMAACRLREAGALAVNPQLLVRPFSKAGFAQHIGDLFSPGKTLDYVADNFPLRGSSIYALDSAHAAGRRPKITIFQNVTDERHLNEHYGEFCRAYGISMEGGTDRSGRLRAVPYEQPGGHKTFPDETALKDAARVLLF